MTRIPRNVRADRKRTKATDRKRAKGIERKHTERNERTDRFAMLRLLETLAGFARYQAYERLYVDSRGRVYQSEIATEHTAQFSARLKAAEFLRYHGYRRRPVHDTDSLFAYDRKSGIIRP